MAKAPDAFRTISEVAELLDTPAHVLRFWESKFAQVKPVKRAGGRRYYRPDDVALLGGIKLLLHDQGMTIKGAQKVLRDRGVKEVSDLGRPAMAEDAPSPEDDVIDAVAMPAAPASPEAETVDPRPAEVPPEEVRRRGVSITSISFIAEEEAEAPAPDDDEPAPRQNVVALSPARPDPAPTAHAPVDLPPMPAPRAITGSRLLGTLARMDRAAVSARSEAIGPLVARLKQARDRLTQR